MSKSSFSIQVAGVTFKSGGDNFQACAPFAYTASNSVISMAYTTPGTSQINWDHAAAATNRYAVSGDVELDSKPTWA